MTRSSLVRTYSLRDGVTSRWCPLIVKFISASWVGKVGKGRGIRAERAGGWSSNASKQGGRLGHWATGERRASVLRNARTDKAVAAAADRGGDAIILEVSTLDEAFLDSSHPR